MCLSDEDGLNYIDSLLKSKDTAESENLDEERRVFRTGGDQAEQFLDIENLT